MSRDVSRSARRLVIFDFDGTLADTWRDIASALNRTLEEAGLARVDGPEVRFWIGDGVLPLLRRAVPQADDARLGALYERFSEHYMRGCLDTTEAYPGIPECLHALGDAALVVASNKPARFLDRVIDGLGLKAHFQIVLGGDSLRVRKPDPAVVAHVIERLAEPVAQVWMVGDGAVDVATGRAAGARTVGCAWGLRGKGELRAAQAEFVVEHPREIPPLVTGSR